MASLRGGFRLSRLIQAVGNGDVHLTGLENTQGIMCNLMGLF